MAYFEWAKDMVIDHGPIDEDHQQLVELVNQLHTATSEGRGIEVIDDVLHKVIDYTLGHLRREEALLESIHYPKLEQHRRQHQQFADELTALQRKFEAGSITVAAQLSLVLREWLSLHIRRSDKEMLPYLRTRRK